MLAKGSKTWHQAARVAIMKAPRSHAAAGHEAGQAILPLSVALYLIAIYFKRLLECAVNLWVLLELQMDPSGCAHAHAKPKQQERGTTTARTAPAATSKSSVNLSALRCNEQNALPPINMDAHARNHWLFYPLVNTPPYANFDSHDMKA